MGTSVRIKGLKRYRHPRTGIEYIYHRGTARRISSKDGTPGFFAELAEIEKELRARDERRAKPGTLRALILSYRETDKYLDLAPRTRADYERVFSFLEPLFDQPIFAFTTPALVRLRDEWRKKRGRRFVNYVRTALVLVMNRAVELGILESNPATLVGKIGRDRYARPLNRPWSVEERLAVWEATATPRWRHLRLPVAIGLCTGLREADVLNLPPTALGEGRIRVRTAKRGVSVEIPILPMLAEAIADAGEVAAITLCVNSKGVSWKGNGFRSGIRKLFKVLEAEGKIAPGLTFHGLRHTVADVLAEAGCTHEDIAAVLGQKSSRVAAHYADKADRSRRTQDAVTKLKPLTVAKR